MEVASLKQQLSQAKAQLSEAQLQREQREAALDAAMRKLKAQLEQEIAQRQVGPARVVAALLLGLLTRQTRPLLAATTHRRPRRGWLG